MADSKPYPLFNSTFTVFKVSPLFHGNLHAGPKSPLSEEALKTHARQLRNTLTKDSIRGLGIAHDSQEYSDTLQDCSWSLLGNETQWKSDAQTESQSPVQFVNSDNARGINVQLKYEKATHCAMLLRDPMNLVDDHPQFTTLPLLLLRMPAAIRNVFLNYLRLNFDCNISAHTLHSIDASLERFIATVSENASSWSPFTYQPSLPAILKNLQIQLTFPSVTKLLKNLDITIAAEDIPPFLEQGKMLVTQQPQLQGCPFIAALSCYLDKHCALRLDQKSVRVSKIVCGVFALSMDGKMKIFAPDRFELDAEYSSSNLDDVPQTPVQIALNELYARLVAEVMPPRDEDVHLDELTPSPVELPGETGKEKMRPDVVTLVGRTRSPAKRSTRRAHTQPATSDLPDSPPPPYALHDLNIASNLVR